jgi:hypothetical protein
MEITDKKLFISEVNQLIMSQGYKDLIKKLKDEEQKRRDEVFSLYVNDVDYTENQVYNEKNSTVEKIRIALYVREEFEKLNLSGAKYLIDEISETLDLAKKNITETVGGLNTGLTMSVYTETDIKLIGANTLKDLHEWYDKKIEELGKEDKNDETLGKVKED